MSDIYLGNTEIEKAYIGDTLIYEKGEDSGGGDSGSDNDYERMDFSNGTEFEAPLGEKNLLIAIMNSSMATKNVTVKNSSTSKSFSYSIPKWKQYFFICSKNANFVLVCTGTSTSIVESGTS